MCHFVLAFLSPFSIAITSLGEERANLSAFRTFVRFVLVWTSRFPLPLGVWEGMRCVILTLPGLFSYLFLGYIVFMYRITSQVNTDKHKSQKKDCLLKQRTRKITKIEDSV